MRCDAGVVVCLERGADDLHMVQLISLPPIISCFIKIQNGLPLCCRLTQIVPEKRPLNGWNSYNKDRLEHYAQRCGMLRDDTKRYGSVADRYRTLRERYRALYRTVTENIDFIHH